MIRCLPLLGPAAQEEVRAVAAVQTLQAANQPPLLVSSSQGHLVPQVVNKLPPQLPSSRLEVHLRARRMRGPLPPGLNLYPLFSLCIVVSLAVVVRFMFSSYE